MESKARVNVSVSKMTGLRKSSCLVGLDRLGQVLVGSRERERARCNDSSLETMTVSFG